MATLQEVIDELYTVKSASETLLTIVCDAIEDLESLSSLPPYNASPYDSMQSYAIAAQTHVAEARSLHQG